MVVVVAVCWNIYRRMRLLLLLLLLMEGRLARKRESPIGGAGEAEIAVDGIERIPGFHGGDRKREKSGIGLKIFSDLRV